MQSQPREGAAVTTPRARFAIGQLIRHKLFDYRGVVVDVDPTFQGAEEWYERMARTRPPKDQPWYHLLVHDAEHMTYVAERNMEPDDSQDPIRHPLLSAFFSTFQDGRYTASDQPN
jgi:heat shock protein HspQ